MRPFLLCIVPVALLSACGELTRPSVPVRSAALTTLASCEDVTAALHARAIARMNARIDANLKAALSGACWGPVDGPWPPGSPAAGGDGEGAPRERSGTNDQVSGVDEPDLVKADDAGHLFIASDGVLQVLDAWPADETRRIASVAVAGKAKRLLVHGDRAVVFSSIAVEGLPPPGGGAEPVPLLPEAWPPECTYGYDCVPQGDGAQLAVTFVDVSDRAAPRVVREARFSGSYLAARRIDDAVHVVVTSPPVSFDGLDHGESLVCGEPRPEPVLRAMFDVLRERNRAVIEGADVSRALPSGTDVTWPGGVRTERPLFAGCPGFLAGPEDDGTAFLSVASFDVADDGPAAITTTLARPGFVYASASSLYVAAPQWWSGGGWFWFDPAPAEEATTIHAFALRGGDAPGSEYRGSAAVKGRVLNQFALDEHDGHLRVATTTGRWTGGMANAVTVLRPTGASLEEVGAVRGIAPGEDVRAVRFDGDRGFVVTFVQTDPLFVLDLADPTSPRVEGEVEVPGFSTYLHLVDPDHLLTIGFDTDASAFFRGIRLQIFDVADATRPALVAAEVIGSRGSASEAASDHLAFGWFAPKGLLAVPMIVCESDDPWGWNATPTFNGLLVYRVDVEAGFTLAGRVEHPLPEPSDPHAPSACWGSWTRSTSLVKRSVFLDDFVYSIAADELRVQDVRALGTDLARVALVGP